VCGGRNGLPASRLPSSLLISVCSQLASYVLLIDSGFIYFASYTYFTSTYFTWMPNAGKCAGEEFAAFSGLIILSSYLVLFISFYFATYKKGGKGAAKLNGKANGHVNGQAKANGVAPSAGANGTPRPRKS
jgi:fatty acid elongase 3